MYIGLAKQKLCCGRLLRLDMHVFAVRVTKPIDGMDPAKLAVWNVLVNRAWRIKAIVKDLS